MTKKILVTGADGFLGSHLSAELERRNLEIHRHTKNNANLDCICSWEDFCKLQDIHGKLDYIFHCTFSSDVIENTLIDTNLIKWWMQCQPQAKLVTFGTDACYLEHFIQHGKVYNHHTEDKYLTGEPHAEWFSYALQKRLLYSTLIGMPFDFQWHHLVLTSLFGANWDLENNHLIPSLIKKCYKASIQGKKIELIGDGTQLKEIVFVEDAVHNILEIVFKNKAINEVINLGSLKKWDTVYNITKMICDYMKTDAEINRGNPKDNGTQIKYLNTSKALKLVDHYADSDFKHSLKVAIDYYLKSI